MALDIQTMFMGLIGFFVLIFIFFLVGGLWFMAGKEGRFHIRRFISRGGIDLLEYVPLSKELVMSKIKWDGKYWVSGKDSIMVGIDPAKGATDTTQSYNAAVSGSGRWKGNRRPVLMSTRNMFFTFGHGFVNMLKEASLFEKYMKKFAGQDEQKALALEDRQKEYTAFIEELDKIKKAVDKETYPKSHTFIYDLLTRVQLGYEGVKIQTIISADEISRYLDGATSQVLYESRIQGKVEGTLEQTKPKTSEGMSPQLKALAISASLVMALVIAYVVVSGGANPVETIKNAIP